MPKAAKVSYQSLNPEIATVTSEGSIEGIASGTTQILISFQETDLSFEVIVK